MIQKVQIIAQNPLASRELKMEQQKHGRLNNETL
jgi:hypothetical protein